MTVTEKFLEEAKIQFQKHCQENHPTLRNAYGECQRIAHDISWKPSVHEVFQILAENLDWMSKRPAIRYDSDGLGVSIDEMVRRHLQFFLQSELEKGQL